MTRSRLLTLAAPVLMALGCAAVVGLADVPSRGLEAVSAQQGSRTQQAGGVDPAHLRPYIGHLFTETLQNHDYRRVLFTGARSQLAVMSIPPGGSIGSERHDYVEQTLVILQGSGHARLDGRPTPVAEGDVLVVTPGTTHDLVNTGPDHLRIFTVYAPPNHLDGRVHPTKEDAERDVDDQRYGENVR